MRKVVWMIPVLLGLCTAALTQEQPAVPPGEPSAAATPNQPAYQPKYAGDPARSDAEFGALAYMRVVTRAQKDYYKKHSQYAPTLAALVGTGSFTKRMAATTERGEYHVGFKGKKDGFTLIMTPKQMDAQHRSFYAEEDGAIHADDQKPASPESPRVK